MKPTRRTFISGVAAASLPALAAKSTPAKPIQNDQAELEACLIRLQAILIRMHPNASIHLDPLLKSREDGSYRLSIQGNVEFQPYQGDGVYIVSDDGWLFECLVTEERIVSSTGKDMGECHYVGRTRAEDGGWDRERYISPNFVRKISCSKN